jgi:hypothetical protein
MTTIQACVNPRLLTKASRLFTGTLEGRIIELLQNARRAGATQVEITNSNGLVTVQDNGQGIDDFAKLLDLGGSGWDEDFEASEDPAGVGLFCLAPRAVTIRSHGQIVSIASDGWTGTPIEVGPDPDPQPGTIIQFEDDEWSRTLVSPLAVFTGMKVAVDDCPCVCESFVSDGAVHHPELGCRIEVRESAQLSQWHQHVQRGHHYCDNVLVNFHGQTLAFDFHPVAEHGLMFLVDLTGAPTGIRLMLPARTQLVENEAFGQLKAALELEAYRYLQRRGHHRLPYKQWLRARDLGIELPEATPTFEVGLLRRADPPEPVEVHMPKDFPLRRCYRFDENAAGAETDETNVHLLAALGKFEEPFVPVDIRSEYDGYTWAKLPTVGQVALKVGKELHTDLVWGGTLTCTDRLVITAHASDGKVLCSPVCMAKAPPKADDRWSDEVLVTPQAEDRLSAEAVWHHLGGWNEDSDTYDTQLSDFESQLDRFWADLRGPDEQLRREVLSALAGLKPTWKSVKVFASGKIRVQFKNRRTKTIQPPRRQHG